MAKILLTGATGNIASQLAVELRKQGVQVRAMARNEEKLRHLAGYGVEVVPGDFDQPATLEKAFAGVDTVFLLTPANPKADVWAAKALAAAKKAGKPYVVRLSVLKAAEDGPTDNVRLHAKTEKNLRDSGLPYAILRPHFFMQNLFMSVPTIASDKAIYMGMGDGKMGMIDVRDIVDVAAKVLLDPSHKGKTYELTGPAAITFYDLARAVSSAIGQEVKYVAIPPEAVAESIRKMGMDEWFATGMKNYSEAYSRGWGDFTTENVKKITGHPARSIEQFAREVFAPALSRN
jgi:uncharacterized protein YbjT (DUF2867 family)